MFGVAVLASVFSACGGYATAQTFVDGLKPAILIGAVFVAMGAVAAFFIPKQVRMAHPELDVEDGVVPEPAPAFARIDG